MNVLITGGTGFIGSALLAKLKARGDQIWVLTRQTRGAREHGQVHYVRRLSDIPHHQAIDAIINLAGEPLVAQRWNRAFKQKLVDSRINTTRMMEQWLSVRTEQGVGIPHVLLNGSAIGFYGNRGDETLTESSVAGEGFASELCQQWEYAAQHVATTHTMRLCLMRIGVVLDNHGGAFEQMRASFDKKVAAQIGQGRQYLSWIHRDDLIDAMLFLLDHKDAHGAFNLTAPEPVNNATFTDVLAQRLRTWIRMAIPAWLMRRLVGEMADELLLSGQNVVPNQLLKMGFTFQCATLDAALDEMKVRCDV